MSCFRHREEKGEGGKGMLANVHNIPLGSLYLLSTGRDHHSSLSVSLRRVNFPYFTTGHTDIRHNITEGLHVSLHTNETGRKITCDTNETTEHTEVVFLTQDPTVPHEGDDRLRGTRGTDLN